MDNAAKEGGRLYIVKHTTSRARRGLLCLNLRHEHVVGCGLVELTGVLANAERELARFRAAGLPVFHAYLQRPHAETRGTLPGLEPLWNEPVFALAHPTALSGADAETMGASVESLCVIGDAGSPLAHAAATAIEQAGADWIVVAEACFARGAVLNFETDGKAARARRARSGNKGANIIWVESWRA